MMQNVVVVSFKVVYLDLDILSINVLNIHKKSASWFTNRFYRQCIVYMSKIACLVNFAHLAE